MHQQIDFLNTAWSFIYNKKNKYILNLEFPSIIKLNVATSSPAIWAQLQTNFFLIKSTSNILNSQSLNYRILTQWTFLYNKIKFTGKGYKIKKTKKHSIQFFFNHSHINLFFLQSALLKKIGKTKTLLYSRNKTTLCNATHNILNIKKINIYTKRGLRLSRSLIYKRTGKKTTT